MLSDPGRADNVEHQLSISFRESLMIGELDRQLSMQHIPDGKPVHTVHRDRVAALLKRDGVQSELV